MTRKNKPKTKLILQSILDKTMYNPSTTRNLQIPCKLYFANGIEGNGSDLCDGTLCSYSHDADDYRKFYGIKYRPKNNHHY